MRGSNGSFDTAFGVRAAIWGCAAGKGGISLAQARALAANARRQIAEGRDPLRQRTQDRAAEWAARAASLVPTFGVLADEVVTALEAG